MVRQLAIDFAYRKTEKETKQESESVSVAVAFAAAEGKRKGKLQIARLSRVSFPFWIVQISADSSILLSTAGLTKQMIELSENKRLSEVRRIISSEITDASVIPDVTETLLPLIKTIEQNSFSLDDIEVPDVIASNGNLVIELELTANPNRLESKIDSQLALKASESFQKLRDAATARADRLEELKSLVKEKLRSHLAVLENMVSYPVTSANFTVANNLRARLQVGTLGAISIGAGKVAVTGQFTAYFNSKTLLDKYLAFTATSLSFVLEDGSANAYVIDFPQVRLTSASRNAAGENQDVMADVGFTAYRDSTEDVTVRITRFAA